MQEARNSPTSNYSSLLKLQKKDIEDFTKSRYNKPSILQHTRPVSPPDDQIVSIETDQGDIQRKYFGSQKLNKLGGPVVARTWYRTSQSPIAFNKVQKKIDVAACSTTELEKLKYIRAEREELQRHQHEERARILGVEVEQTYSSFQRFAHGRSGRLASAFHSYGGQSGSRLLSPKSNS